ncbi:MAG TPA: AsmA family protein [Terracidiphilus sp.]|nr:AsmA family protein [Terracidiphilus sp.]
MTEDAHSRRTNRRRLWLILLVIALLVLAVVVPPLLNIGRYKVEITELMAGSLGRPVRLGSVELQLLPRPAFVLSDLTVEEDPAFGAEPILHASSVTADIELLSLWRGRLAISRVSVDEASINLVRNSEGRWNLDSLFRSAAHSASKPDAREKYAAVPLPYLEASDSRINIKNGLEKLPFSLVNADLSFWQENPGDWRLRVRGQPARTDVNLDLADTGEVRLEARLRRADQLREMPLHIDMEWREAQLGQLSRLLVGSDPGWRGDLTAEFHLDGTAETARVTTQLRAAGVHRAEFAPADPLDFDANCNFVYHYSSRALDDLKCDSPLGDGHIEVEGDLPASGPPRLSVGLQKISVQAGLDLLRTMRSGLDEDLEAKGQISGRLIYDTSATATPAKKVNTAPQMARKAAAVKRLGPAADPLTGNLTVDGFVLSGGGLSQPIRIPKIVFAPAPFAAGQQALSASFDATEGGPKPLAITARVARGGYQMTLQGPVSLARMRELAHLLSPSTADRLSAFTGGPAVVDLTAEGPWLPTPAAITSGQGTGGAAEDPDLSIAVSDDGADHLTGTLVWHDARWRSDLLANPVEIDSATLHLAGQSMRWEPVSFSYGTVKGNAALEVPLGCESLEPCPPRLDLRFANLDAATLQAALLGARKPDTLLSSLIARLTSSQSPVWPQVAVTVKAGVLDLGPVTLKDATAALQMSATEAQLTSLDASLLGGRIHMTGTVSSGNAPVYSLAGDFTRVAPPEFCRLINLRCSGGTIHGNGKVELAGFTARNLSASANGALNLEWRRGAVRGGGSPGSKLPAALARFDRWTIAARIADGAVTVEENQIQAGSRKAAVEVSVPLSEPVRVTFHAPRT